GSSSATHVLATRPLDRPRVSPGSDAPLAQPAVEPGPGAQHRVLAVARLAQPVAFAWIMHELRRNAERAQRLVQLARLRDRRARVVVADQDQRGRLRPR